MDAVNKFYILKEFGSAYTWDAIDLMEYYNYQLLILCQNADVRAQKLESDRTQFYQKEAV